MCFHFDYLQVCFISYLILVLVFLVTSVMAGITNPITWIICITWTVYVYWAHAAMTVRWMVFGEIVGQIGCAWFPKHIVAALADYILYRIEPHIHFVGPFSWMVLPVVSRTFYQGWLLLVPLICSCKTMPPLLRMILIELHVPWCCIVRGLSHCINRCR